MREAHANACRAGDAMGSRSVDRVGVCYCLLTIYHSGGSYISRAFQPQIAFLCFISPQRSSHYEEHGTEWLLQRGEIRFLKTCVRPDCHSHTRVDQARRLCFVLHPQLLMELVSMQVDDSGPILSAAFSPEAGPGSSSRNWGQPRGSLRGVALYFVARDWAMCRHR